MSLSLPGFGTSKSKSRKVKLDVEIEIRKLLDIPQRAGGQIYVKLKCEKGRAIQAFHQQRTHSAEVREHTATWNEKYSANAVIFPVSPSTNTLHPMVVRLSVRQETKGGKGFARMGLVFLNLAELAGHRSNTSMFTLVQSHLNCRLQISTKISLVEGDPLWRPLNMPGNDLSSMGEDVTGAEDVMTDGVGAVESAAGAAVGDSDVLLNTFLESAIQEGGKDILNRLVSQTTVFNSNVVYPETLRLAIERSRFGIHGPVEQIVERHVDDASMTNKNPLNLVGGK